MPYYPNNVFFSVVASSINGDVNIVLALPLLLLIIASCSSFTFAFSSADSSADGGGGKGCTGGNAGIFGDKNPIIYIILYSLSATLCGADCLVFISWIPTAR